MCFETGITVQQPGSISDLVPLVVGLVVPIEDVVPVFVTDPLLESELDFGFVLRVYRKRGEEDCGEPYCN